MLRDKKIIGRILGPFLFLLTILFFNPEGMTAEAKYTLASTIWIAVWWVTEAIPIPVTSLLPLIFLPAFGVSKIPPVADAYINPIIFLFIGGFMLALAMEKWNLHRRIALNIIYSLGANSQMLVLGFMVATAFLSMWISNTATTLMMVPIALAIVGQLSVIAKTQGENQLGKALMLAIAFSASIGGMATLVGTPTNLIFSGYVLEKYNIDITFDQWFVYGFPLSILLLIVVWWHLVYNAFPLKKMKTESSKAEIKTQLDHLGKMSFEEKWVMIVFGIVALGWITRSYLLKPLIPNIHDSMIAIGGAMILFLIPSKNAGGSLLDWETAVKLPWGILLLFGGAFAVAFGFEESGLAAWMAEQLIALKNIPFFFILLIIVGFVNFLTEVTQNMATCTLMMPVLASLSPALDVHPFALMAAVCVASSCAFMLPFATAPNVIVFSSGQLEMKEMIRAGVWLNILSILIITIFSYFVLPEVWAIELNQFPSSFTP